MGTNQKDRRTREFINKECIKQKLTVEEFKKKIDDAMYEDNSSHELPSTPSVYRWYNGEVTPLPKMQPYIAKALGVSVDELRAGRRSREKELEAELLEIKELYTEETNTVMNLLHFNKYYSCFFSNALLSLGLFFINATLFKNPILYLIAILWFIMIIIKDSIAYKKEIGNKQSYVKTYRNDVNIVKEYIHKDHLIGNALKVILLIVIFVSFLPFIESLFYRGTFYITSIVYMTLGIILVIRAIHCKY